MEWISVRNRLPETTHETINDEYGLHKQSEVYLVATRHGGVYLGYLELRRLPKRKRWIPTWYVSSIQDDGIDCDGVIISDVVAWMQIPKLS